MQIGNRFRCNPSPPQKQTLLRWIGCQTYIYNAKVGEDRYFRRFAQKSLAHTGQYAPIDQQYSHFKTELTPWLSDVPGVVLRNGTVLWKQAYSRYFSKLGGRPVIQKKHGKRSVWLTAELFEFKPVVDTATGEITGHELHLGTKKHPLGVLPFTAHHAYQIPNSIHVSVLAGQWHLSFNYDNGVPEPSDKDTAAWLMQYSEAELRALTVGLDRGVALPLAGSDGQRFEFSPAQQRRLIEQERHKQRWQRRMARRTQGSAGWVRAKHKVARYQRYGADVRRDLAHKTSYTLADDAHYKLYVFEALKVQNMTRRAKLKQDANGKWLRNGARAKSGLNKAILASAWGQTKIYLQYKARRRGKLTIEVPPFYSSQECAACTHTHQDNRHGAEFVCLRCGNTDHADHNAAKVIALRGVKRVIKGECVPKNKKRCKITRSTVGAVCSEPVVATPSTPMETSVRRRGGNIATRGSLKLETLATTTLVV